MSADLLEPMWHQARAQTLRSYLVSADDTGMPVLGLKVPHWRAVLDMARRVAEAIELGYLGVDIVVDAEAGPMLLEANARPGLAIQIANGRGLAPRLRAIDARHEHGIAAVEPVATERAYRKSA